MTGRGGRRAAGPPVAALIALLLAATMAGSASAESASITASVQVASIVMSVAVTISSPAARVGDTVKAAATVTNGGTARTSNVRVSLRVDAAGLAIKGANPVTIAQLQPGHAKSVSWSLCALQAGNYLVLARVTVDGVSIDSPAVLLSVAGQRKKGC